MTGSIEAFEGCPVEPGDEMADQYRQGWLECWQHQQAEIDRLKQDRNRLEREAAMLEKHLYKQYRGNWSALLGGDANSDKACQKLVGEIRKQALQEKE